MALQAFEIKAVTENAGRSGVAAEDIVAADLV
jgi:hypothetical protein